MSFDHAHNGFLSMPNLAAHFLAYVKRGTAICWMAPIGSGSETLYRPHECGDVHVASRFFGGAGSFFQMS